MRNLTAPKQYEDSRGTSFDAGCEGLVLYTPAGDAVRLHVGADGHLYINGHPFGVAGMPPALHAAMHAEGGGDALTPASIGALPAAAVGELVAPLVGGLVPAQYVAGMIDPAHHAGTHAAGGDDAITPASIRAVADTDPRLGDKRAPLEHAAQHAKGQPDALTPAAIGAVPMDDGRLTNARTPLSHSASHHKNGPDPISWADVGAVDAELLTVRDRVPGGVPQLNDIGHIDVNLLPQFALRPSAHAETHRFDGADALTAEMLNAADRKHSHGDADITGVDAGKITSGVLDMARIPPAALDRLWGDVADEAARYALTVDEVQNGDSVRQMDSTPPVMWVVVDEGKLHSAEGWREYAAGTAARVPWAGVQDKPEYFNPQTHAARHHTGGDDALTPADIGAATIAQNAAAVALAQQGVDDAENARVLAVAAQTSAHKAEADAASANANAETRALQTDFAALGATVAALGARMTALEGAAVTSPNIRVISGTTLADGVGMLEFEPK